MKAMKENNSKYPHSTWRLLISKPTSGAWNMAVDSALLENASSQKSLPTLRLYAWSPPCLSLGYSQPIQDIDRQALNKLGWDLVRRPTGGRAILHTDELTYAVIGRKEDPRLEGGVLSSYRRLSAALFTALKTLDLPVEVQESRSDSFDNQQPICFENPSNYEITVQGKKLIGSAQARKKEGVLQHGTLPLSGDITRITRALNFPDQSSREQAAARMASRATTIKNILGVNISWQQAAEAFQTGFQDELNITLQPGNLSTDELELAEEYHQKHQQHDWLHR